MSALLPIASPYGSVHGLAAHPELAAALELVDGYMGATAAFQRANAAYSTAAAESITTTSQQQLTDQTVDALLAGKPVPAEIGQRALDAANAAAVRDVTLKTLQEARLRVSEVRDSLLVSGLNVILAQFDRRVRETVTEARTLNAPATAEEAIAAGRVEQWSRRGDLRDLYVQLRGLQDSLMSALAGVSGANGNLNDFGAIRNFADVYPEWLRDRRGRGERYDVETGMALRNSIIPEDPARLFDWLLEHPEAEPWVPSKRQLDDVVRVERQLAEARIRAEDQDQPVQHKSPPPLRGTREHRLLGQIAR